MPLQKTIYKNALKQGFIQVFSNPNINNNVEAVAEALANVMADNTEIFVKTGKAVGSDSNGDTHALTIE